MSTTRTNGQIRLLSVLTLVSLVVIWEVCAQFSPKTALAQTAIIPSFTDIFGRSLLGMADYWKFPFWAPNTSMGGQQTYLGAILALGYHSAVTISRLVMGLAGGFVIGVGFGLVTSWSPVLRQALSLPINMFRMVPLLAMIPLFQFWVGTNTQGVVTFVIVGTGTVFFVGTVNAIANVPVKYTDYARTLGCSEARIYMSVVLPAIIPELLSSISLSLGLAWSAVVAGEYVGIDTGLGRILTFAQFMSQTGRMALIAIVITAYAAASYALCSYASRKLLAWRRPNER